MDAIIKDCNFKQEIEIKGKPQTYTQEKREKATKGYPFTPYILRNLTTSYCSNHGTDIGQRTKQRKLPNKHNEVVKHKNKEP